MADMKKTLELMTQTLTANGLTRVAVKLDDFEIEIEKNLPPVVTSVNRIDETVAIPAIVATKAPSGKVVKAPLIGTFYEASAPGKPPFVKVGDSVKRDDVLFIIESMKLMNEVTSEFDGVVKEIYVKNADVLEFDQPVMVIE
ncbi:MAG: acetyl-CoA carboxylase, biotin carboxyl carrier protein [Ruminococcus sp.]|jgi:acetyl-CoA carboxylase biotin carboxyl carrier protein|nr:acetyl-CoA carboxylase, biotin carboxyl carrier protein [Ruminococcus sp.]